MTPQNDEKLLPCPFCGCKAEMQPIKSINEKEIHWYVMCQCGGHVSIHSGREDAIKAWNLRTPTPLRPLDEEAVKEIVLEENKTYGFEEERIAKSICTTFGRPAGMNYEDILKVLNEVADKAGYWGGDQSIARLEDYASALHQRLGGK